MSWNFVATCVSKPRNFLAGVSFDEETGFRPRLDFSEMKSEGAKKFRIGPKSSAARTGEFLDLASRVGNESRRLILATSGGCDQMAEASAQKLSDPNLRDAATARLRGAVEEIEPSGSF